MTEHNERRGHGGPINGRLGMVLAGANQLRPLFWMALGLFLTLGFGLTTPGQTINDVQENLLVVNQKMAVMEDMLTSLILLECDRIPARDANLVKLDCSSIRASR